MVDTHEKIVDVDQVIAQATILNEFPILPIEGVVIYPHSFVPVVIREAKAVGAVVEYSCRSIWGSTWEDSYTPRSGYEVRVDRCRG